MPYGVLAKRAGVSRKTLYGILHAGTDARLKTVAAIATALGTEIRFEDALTDDEMRSKQAAEQASRRGAPLSDAVSNRTLWRLAPKSGAIDAA